MMSLRNIHVTGSVQLAVFIENGFYFYLYHELEAMMETF